MTPEEAKAFMVYLLRTAAQLVEDGVIKDWSIDRAFGHRVVPDSRGMMHQVSTGQETMVITLEAGHLSSDKAASWLPGRAPELPKADPKGGR